VSSAGEVRFWDSIGIGLAGAERFSTTKISMTDNEMVQGLEQLDVRKIHSHLIGKHVLNSIQPMVYIARTKTRLHRLTVTPRPGTGKFVLVAVPFNDGTAQNTTWLSSFRIFQRKSNPWDSGDIVTLVPQPGNKDSPKAKSRSEEKCVWVLTNRNLMQWYIGVGGGEEVCFICVQKHHVADGSYSVFVTMKFGE